MPKLFSIFAAAVLLCGTTVASDKPQTPAQLRAMADAASGEHCAHVCMDAARALVEESNAFYTSGEVAKGLADMTDAARYAQKATEGSIQSHKHQKQTEIALRKLSKRMVDIKDTLNFEDKPPILDIVNSVDRLRVRILAAMFDLEAPKEATPKENK